MQVDKDKELRPQLEANRNTAPAQMARENVSSHEPPVKQSRKRPTEEDALPSVTTKRPRIQVTSHAPSYETLLEECLGDEIEAQKQFDYLQQFAAQQQRKVSVAPSVEIEPGANRGPRASSHLNVVEHATDTESNPESEIASEAESVESQTGISQLKWAKPKQMSEMVGVSMSVLRRWAQSKAVETLVSEGGHRSFSVQSVKDYIEAAATKAKPLNSINSTLIFVHIASSSDSDCSEDDTVTSRATRIKAQLTAEYPSAKTIIEAAEAPLSDYNQRPGLNRLYKYLDKHQIGQLVVQNPRDITETQDGFRLFEWFCNKHDVEVVVDPKLYDL